MSTLPAHGLPTRHGVSPSCVGLPPGPWASMLDFLVERFPAIDRSVWLQRMAAGEVVDEHGEPVTAEFQQVAGLAPGGTAAIQQPHAP